MTQTRFTTGARPDFGNRASHSHRPLRRPWEANLQSAPSGTPGLGRLATSRPSALGITEMDRRGSDVTLARLLPEGGRF